MKVLVVGGGGREHAIIKKLRTSPLVEEIFALPGNGGISVLAECVPIKATDIDGICAFAASENIDFAVVTPDDPLVLGAVDALEAMGVRCFGPRANAAIIEGSKLFAKELMEKYDIPTARYRAFSDEAAAIEYIRAEACPIVIKADGLALGKGVTVAATREEAEAAVHRMMGDRVFGKSGERIVIEECLSGPEVSVLALTDGETIIPLLSSMDHKRAFDNDEGPNTGGMGAIAPNPFYTEEVAAICMEKIFLPTVNAMKAEGRPFSGCLYFGLMLTEGGPKVIEYNCRFGDPETEAVLPLLESDLMELMLAVNEGRLSDAEVRFSKGACCCVVMASGGYPVSYKTGFPIAFGKAAIMPGVSVYHAGTARGEGGFSTAGGRVLAISAVSPTMEGAIGRSYSAAAEISFEGAHFRRDIGKSAGR